MSVLRDSTISSLSGKGVLITAAICTGAIAIVAIVIMVIYLAKKTTTTLSSSSGAIGLTTDLPESGSYYSVRFENGGNTATSAESAGLALDARNNSDPFQKWLFTKLADISEGVATYRIKNSSDAAFTLAWDTNSGTLLGSPNSSSSSQVWTVTSSTSKSTENPAQTIVYFTQSSNGALTYDPPSGSPSTELTMSTADRTKDTQKFYLVKL